MKELLLTIVLAALGLTLLRWSATWHRAMPALGVVVRPVRLRGPIPGRQVRVLHSPVGGHVLAVYFEDGQAVKAGDPLLKLVVGTGPGAHLVFVKAPAAGYLAALDISPGPYLPAGTPYAWLILPRAVPVTTTALRLP
ncbi:hypothetical protein A0257_22840 (plasmid) [Hymenobacter psoromatis]|nr:hypothetical protein A0257_22840 [Hymenobacter psoromatis]